MTTLEPSKVFEPERDCMELADVENDDTFADETEALITSHDKQTDKQETTVVQRKVTVRTVSTKDLDLDMENEDYYEEVTYDDEEQGHGKPNSSPFSFEIKIRNVMYNISFPDCVSMLNRWVSTYSEHVMRFGWIILTMYVMTESIRRFDNHTGAFSGTTSAERVRINPHAGEPLQPITTYGEGNPNLGNDDPNFNPTMQNLHPGLTVSEPKIFSPNTVDETQLQPSSSVMLPPPLAFDTTGPVSIEMSQESFATLPPMLEENLSDITVPMSETETPIFWHIPRAGGTLVKTLLGTCLQKVMATEMGTLDGHDQDTQLEVVQRERPAGKFVNIDATSLDGLARAKSMNLANSGMAQVIVTSHFQEGSDIFTNSDHHGRWFCILRHPVERAISIFYFLSSLKMWGPDVELTIEDYVKSDRVESNWMIRYLIGKKSGDVGIDELNMAKEILRKKFIIGIFEDMDSSLFRFQRFFGWTIYGEDQRQCADRLLHQMKIGENNHEPVMEGSDVWNALLTINNWDMKLYEYGIQLFNEQQIMMNN